MKPGILHVISASQPNTKEPSFQQAQSIESKLRRNSRVSDHIFELLIGLEPVVTEFNAVLLSRLFLETFRDILAESASGLILDIVAVVGHVNDSLGASFLAFLAGEVTQFELVAGAGCRRSRYQSRGKEGEHVGGELHFR